MKLTFLGTGTSHGVPVIACNCPVCTSTEQKDKRNRSSVYISTNDNHHILIDITPEFRIQCLLYKIYQVDEVLLTHSHADHLHGIDDLRIFSSAQSFPKDNQNKKNENKPPIPIYSSEKTCAELKERFPYLFMEVKEGGGHAKISLNTVKDQFFIGNTRIIPIPMMHGHMPTTGWLLTQWESSPVPSSQAGGLHLGQCSSSQADGLHLGQCSSSQTDGSPASIAYLTDCNFISEESFFLIKENCGSLKHLIIDGLRIKEHSTHFNFLQALKAADKIGVAEHVWITHLTHNLSHKDTLIYLNEHLNEFPNLKNTAVSPAWDGLLLEI